MVAPGQVSMATSSKSEIVTGTQSAEARGTTPLAYDEIGNVRVSVFFPDYNIQVSALTCSVTRSMTLSLTQSIIRYVTVCYQV